MLARRLLIAAMGIGGFDVTLPFSGALVTRSTDLTVTNDTFQVVTFDVEEYDTDGYWSSGAGDRFTIPVDGFYLYGCALRWSAANNNNSGVRGGGFWINGDDPALIQDLGYQEWPSSPLTGALMHMTPVGPPRELSAGDYLRVHAYQYTNGGASLDLDSSQGRTPAMWIVRLG
jgi:hypothetical protein